MVRVGMKEPERDTDPEMTEMKERTKKVDPDDAYDRMREIERMKYTCDHEVNFCNGSCLKEESEND